MNIFSPNPTPMSKNILEIFINLLEIENKKYITFI